MAKPLDYQPVSLPIMGGVEQKVDGVVVPSPRLKTADNVMSDKTGSLQRRHGRSALSSLEIDGTATPAGASLATYKGQLVQFAANKLFEYSEIEGRWVDKGDAHSMKLQYRGIAKSDISDIVMCDMAYSEGLFVFVFCTTTGQVRVSISDFNGTIVHNQTIAGSGGTRPRVVAKGGTVLVYYADTSSGVIKAVPITTDGTPQEVATDLATPAVNVATGNSAGELFDVCVEPTGAGHSFIAFVDTTATPGRITFGFVSSAGTLSNTSTLVTSDDARGIGVCPGFAGATDMHGVVYHTDAADGVRAAIRQWTGSAWVATATSGDLDPLATQPTTEITCLFTSATLLRVVFSGDVATTAAIPDRLIQSTFTTAGVAATRVSTLLHCRLASKSFSFNDENFITVIRAKRANEGIQDTFFVIRLSDARVTARVLPAISWHGALGLDSGYMSNLGNVVAVQGALYWAALYKRILSTQFARLAKLATGQSSIAPGGTVGAVGVLFRNLGES